MLLMCEVLKSRLSANNREDEYKTNQMIKLVCKMIMKLRLAVLLMYEVLKRSHSVNNREHEKKTNRIIKFVYEIIVQRMHYQTLTITAHAHGEALLESTVLATVSIVPYVISLHGIACNFIVYILYTYCIGLHGILLSLRMPMARHFWRRQY